MRSLRFDTTNFIAEYRQAQDAGLTLRELADLMGITYGNLCCRKHALAKRGIKLPPLRRGRYPKRKAAKTIMRLAAPVQVHVETAPMTFTIDVGVGHA